MKLNTPIQIGKHILKNRITFAPTVKFDYTDDSGKANEKLISHYEERAKGGCGLICVEAVAVTPGGRFDRRHMGLWSDEQIPGHKELTKRCHEYGTVMLIQLNHTGYTANPECGPAIGPSAVVRKDYRGEYTTHAMSIDEIEAMKRAYVDAAVRAQTAGYDGVQLHGCHGYLINQFMSPATNKRNDQYGGTAENRARFCCEIIREIRKICGEEFLISVRTSGFDCDLSDAVAVAEEYVKAGCGYLQVSNGLTSLQTLAPFRDARVTDIQSLGVYFHDNFKGRVPVSCVGGLTEGTQIEYLIENEYVDTVDVARAILADPEFANAVLNHKDYVKCFGCKACQYGPFTAHQCPAELKRKKNA